jgi:hypothetical protein
MLMEQVEQDNAADCLKDLFSKIGTGCDEDPTQNVSNLSEVFQDRSLNPFNLPFEYFLNGSLPE